MFNVISISEVYDQLDNGRYMYSASSAAPTTAVRYKPTYEIRCVMGLGQRLPLPPLVNSMVRATMDSTDLDQVIVCDFIPYEVSYDELYDVVIFKTTMISYTMTKQYGTVIIHDDVVDEAMKLLGL